MRNDLACLGLLAAALLCASPAVAGTLVKYSAEVGTKRAAKAGDMDMEIASLPPAAPTRAGRYALNGVQRSISNPRDAEVVHVQQGEVSWVGQSGKAQRVRKGDVLFFAARRSITARDAADYADHFIIFPALGPAADAMPDTLLLNPGDLDPSSFTPNEGGGEHVYLASDDGARIVGWRAAAEGSVSRSADIRYLAVTGGRAVFSEADAQIALAAGDTLLIPAGSTFQWRAEGLIGVYVSVPPAPAP
jgi:uncharacterized cupin superfamily protein